jgi:hypothetical protein
LSNPSGPPSRALKGSRGGIRKLLARNIVGGLLRSVLWPSQGGIRGLLAFNKNIFAALLGLFEYGKEKHLVVCKTSRVRVFHSKDVSRDTVERGVY